MPTKIHPGHLFCKLWTTPAGQTRVRCPERRGTSYRYARMVQARSCAESVATGCPCAPWPQLAGAQQAGAGTSAHGPMPHVFAECLAPDALRRVSKKCHRKGNCTVAADRATFGDPCLPGMKKQLRVSYTCGEGHPRGWGLGGHQPSPCCAHPVPRGQGCGAPAGGRGLLGTSEVVMLSVCSPCSAQAAAGGGGPGHLRPLPALGLHAR